MKSLLVIVASLFFSSDIKTENFHKTELTDSFTDMVQSVFEEGAALVVRFQRHASLFKITKEHPQFTEIKAKLEKAQKIDQKVKVVAIIPSMTIKEIKA